MARSTPGCGDRTRACSTCAPATAAWRCWRRWPGRRPRSTPPTCRSDALAVARINVDTPRPGRPHHAACRRRPCAALGGRYDLILCNPPYVNAHRWPRCRPSTAPSRRWHWPAATTAWTSSARCCDGAGAHERATPRWCSRSATSARTSKPRFPRLEVGLAATSAGDDQVLLVTREALLSRHCTVITLREPHPAPRPKVVLERRQP